MKKVALICLVILTQLLISCNHKTEPALDTVKVPRYKWTCDTGLLLDWTFADVSRQQVKLRLDNNSQQYLLDEVYETDAGTLYSDGEIALRVKDGKAKVFWTNNDDVIGQDCSGPMFTD